MSYESLLQDLTHALKLAPDKSSVNTSSGSEETAKDQSASEDTNTKEPSAAEDISKEISKDISKDKEAGEESITSESEVKIEVEDKEKDEAVTICDEENTTAEVEKAPSTGRYPACINNIKTFNNFSNSRRGGRELGESWWR